VHPDGRLPELRNVLVGDAFAWGDGRYEVANILEAHYLGTEGELPFTTFAKGTSTFVDLVSDDGRFATVDGTEAPPLLYLGEYVSFDDLAMTQLRDFEGW
jgi:hypothetical protein